jgi:hypothetical protein
MDEKKIRDIFINVIKETLAKEQSGELAEYNPAYSLEEMIPNLLILFKNPEYENFHALYHLLDYWSDAMTNGFEFLGEWKHQIDVKTAKSILQNALSSMEQGVNYSDEQLFIWLHEGVDCKPRKGCLFNILK